MTIRELIAFLSAYDPDTEVLVPNINWLHPVYPTRYPYLPLKEIELDHEGLVLTHE